LELSLSFALAQKSIARIVKFQFVLLFFAAIGAALIFNKNTGFSVFLGGMACWLPTVLFAMLAFGVRRTSMVFLGFFMLGEVLRLLIGAILFVLVVKLFPVHVLAVLIGFIGAIVAFWVASLGLLFEQKKVELS